MAISHTLTRNWNDGVGSIGGSETVSWGAGPQIDEAIPSNQTDLLVAFAFTNAKLKAIIITADVNMTIKTNSSGSPQETLTILAGVPFMWSLTASSIGAAASPFAGNVTALYVTNTTAGTLRIRSSVDPT